MCPPITAELSSSSTATAPRDATAHIPPDELSLKAYDYARQHLHPDILHHSIRVYLFARALATRDDSEWTKPDRLPLLFTACILHDIGTCHAHDGAQRFEVEGADAATHLLRLAGLSEAEMHEVWVAIALHTSPGIAERISPFANLVRLAVLIDFKRPSAMELVASEQIEAAERAFPRGEIEKVLGDAVVEQAWEQRAKAPPASWAGVLMRSRLENPGWEGVNKAF